MSDIAISVDNLSKSYLVGHNTAQAERYTALRDVVSRNARSLARKTRDMLSGRAIVQGDEVEEFWALKNVSFEVKHGEVLGIIGRNGAGKSTLLKILSRITEPTSGRIKIAGRVASLLEVGTGFHPELSGRENIFLNGAILGMPGEEVRQKFDEIVEFSGVEKFLDTPVKRYSSGMYVRLAFAVAAHLEPEILIVDEVLAVGDAEFQKKCLGKMSEVSSGGRTVLFVSHNLQAVEHFCKNALLLDRGQLLSSGPVHDVMAEYRINGFTPLGKFHSMSLGDELELLNFNFLPSQIRFKENLGFVIEFEVKQECNIHDMHILIYNSFDVRVAIIDLRDASKLGGTRSFLAGGRVVVSGNIKEVKFVEGNYRVGIYYRSSVDVQAHYGIIEFSIFNGEPAENIMPYAAEYQGTTVIDCDFEFVVGQNH